MKKQLIPLFIMLTPIALSALPLGNPWEASIQSEGVFYGERCPSEWGACNNWCDAASLRLGYYGDFVYDRHLQVDTNESHAHIHQTQIWTNAAYLALNFWDRVDLFGTLGATHLRLASANSAFGVPLVPAPIDGNFDYLHIDTDTRFSWSIGIKGTLWECGPLEIGAETQFFHAHPNISSLYSEGLDTFYPQNIDLKYEEWQVGLGASYRINIAACSTALIPYLGVMWNHCRINMGNAVTPALEFADDVIQAGPTLFNLQNEREWGWAVGLTLLGCNRASITVEGRYVDEKALYINGQFRF